MSDMFAIGAIERARALGLRVPDDLSVVGFDDIPLASQLSPPLTTVRQPLVEKGRIAAELLFGRRVAAGRSCCRPSSWCAARPRRRRRPERRAPRLACAPLALERPRRRAAWQLTSPARCLPSSGKRPRHVASPLEN